MPIAMMIVAAHTLTGAYAQADFFGKLIYLGLFVLSMVCWIFLLYKWWMIRQVKLCSRRFIEALVRKKEGLFDIRVETLPKMRHKELPHPLSSLFSVLKEKTVELLDKNHFFIGEGQPVHLSQSDVELLETHMHATMVSQREKLGKNLFVLSTIATLAPFLGLLGTVWGMLVTFSELQAQGMVGANGAMLGGLSTALVTTILGLVIAIPAIIANNYLKNAVSSFSAEMEGFSHQLLSTVELQYRKVDVR